VVVLVCHRFTRSARRPSSPPPQSLPLRIPSRSMTSVACWLCSASRARFLCGTRRSGRLPCLVGARSRPQRRAAYPRAPLRAFSPRPGSYEPDWIADPSRAPIASSELELGDQQRDRRRRTAGRACARASPTRGGCHDRRSALSQRRTSCSVRCPAAQRGRRTSWPRPRAAIDSTAARLASSRRARLPRTRLLRAQRFRYERASAYRSVECLGSRELEVDHNVVPLILTAAV